MLERECRQILGRELKNRQTDPEKIISSEFSSRSLEDIFKDIGRWKDEDPDALALLDDVLGTEVATHIRSLIFAFHAFCDLPNLGIIDFGRVRIDNRDKILTYYGIG